MYSTKKNYSGFERQREDYHNIIASYQYIA